MMGIVLEVIVTYQYDFIIPTLKAKNNVILLLMFFGCNKR